MHTIAPAQLDAVTYTPLKAGAAARMLPSLAEAVARPGRHKAKDVTGFAVWTQEDTPQLLGVLFIGKDGREWGIRHVWPVNGTWAWGEQFTMGTRDDAARMLIGAVWADMRRTGHTTGERSERLEIMADAFDAWYRMKAALLRLAA